MKEFTLLVIKIDMAINWTLGSLLIFSPRFIERLIASGQIFPDWLWRLVGILLASFAFWQTKVLRRGKIKPGELSFSAAASFIPALILTAGLMMDFPLFFSAKLLLWVAVFYMLALGGWYLYVLKNQSGNLSF